MPWWSYYSVDNFTASSDPQLPEGDRMFAELLGCDPGTLAHSGVGTCFTRVFGVVPDRSSDDLGEIDAWFAHGDPWHALVGVAAARIVVGSVRLFEGGYIGPPSLTCVGPKSLSRDDVDFETLATLIDRARRATVGRMTRCKSCDSPRYGPGCRCDAEASGIIYD